MLNEIALGVPSDYRKSRKFVAEIFDVVVKECSGLREAGQKEYTGGSDAFGNFDRLSAELQIDRKKVLWTYATKHKDGIVAYLNGHESQREPVEGRINDLIVYLFLLRGMIEEEKATKPQFESLG